MKFCIGIMRKFASSDLDWCPYEAPKNAQNPSHQISANNSTTLNYSKITQYSAINCGRILGCFGGYNSTRVIFESELNRP